jgi:hypothetical protein
MQTSYSPNAPRGQEVFGGFGARINPFTGEEKFAEGGEVGVSAPKSPFALQQSIDPNVLATRKYIEELNARAMNPTPGGGMGDAASGGLGRFKVPFTPYVGPGDGGGGGGEAAGGGAADIAGAIATGYLTNPSNWPGIASTVRNLPDAISNLPGTVRDVSTLGTEVFSAPDRAAAAAEMPVEVSRVPATNAASAVSAGAGVSSLIPRAGRVLVDGFSIADDVAGLGNLSGSVNSVADLTAIPSINTGTQAGLGSLMQNKILPGVGTVLGAYETGKAIEQGKEGRAAFNAAMTAASAGKLFGIGALGGPAGMLAAAAIAAIGASMVNTKEYGDKALANYWKAVDQGRGFGSAPPEELAQGFINF